MRACARCVRVGNGNAARLVPNGAARHGEHCFSNLALDLVSVRNQGKVRDDVAWVDGVIKGPGEKLFTSRIDEVRT